MLASPPKLTIAPCSASFFTEIRLRVWVGTQKTCLSSSSHILPLLSSTPHHGVPLPSTRVRLPLALPTSVLNASSSSLKRALSFSMKSLQPESTSSSSPPSTEAPSKLRKLKKPCFSGPLLVPLDCPSCSCNP